MNLLEILKKIFSCAMPQAASEGDTDPVSPSDKTNDTISADNAEVEDMDSVSPADKTNDTASADDAEVEDMDPISPADKTNNTASADDAEVEGIRLVALNRSKAEVIEGYGQVRTMADILISMNDQYHFHNSKEAVAKVQSFIASQSPCHIAISEKAFHFIADALYSPMAFVNGKLNIDALEDNFNISEFEKKWDNAMYRYYYAKIWKLIRYFNEFRRYTSPEQICEDLKKTITPEYYTMGDSASVFGYPHYFFTRAIEEVWNEIAPNNSIDPDLLDKYMFRNHEVAIQTLGLEATIRKDFVQDYCHTDVYFPQKIGSAPVYIERIIGKGRIFLKSCGEGKGPNNNPELLEFNIACRLLLEDSKYNIWEDKNQSMLFVPKEDISLPAYYYCSYYSCGKILFEDNDHKKEFLKEGINGRQLMNENDRKALIKHFSHENIQ